jgi:Chlorophyll A-B binding protein
MIKVGAIVSEYTMNAEKKLVDAASFGESSVEPAFGWTKYAEQINGRFAMLGFVLLIFLEFFTKQDLITWLGLR